MSQTNRVLHCVRRYLKNGVVPGPTLINKSLGRVSYDEHNSEIRRLRSSGIEPKGTPRKDMNNLSGKETKERAQALKEFGCKKVNNRWKLPGV